MRILISFIAYQHDFKELHNNKAAVEKDGPTHNFHQFFYDSQSGTYTKHILLAADKTSFPRLQLLASSLRSDYPGRKIEEVNLNLNQEDVVDITKIKPPIEEILLKHKDAEIDIFFSPGTSIMQLSWFLCHATLGLKTRLLQTFARRFDSGNKPTLKEIQIEKSFIPLIAQTKEIQLNTHKQEIPDFLITPSIKPVYERARKVAHAPKVTTLIRGESGTGKENLSRYIHKNSVRSKAPFITINCSSLGDNLLESRLFGHKKGSFTGADRDHTGIFQQAEGGTVFLDEIGDISPYMQQSLLRFFQEKEIQPIGGSAIKVDVRIIAATHRDLEALCNEGKFRWDLYYRLTVTELELPTLLERGNQEIELLLDYFIEKKQADLRSDKKIKLSKEARAKILSYSFPGNIRELENLVESLYVFLEEEVVEVKDLPKRIIATKAHEGLSMDSGKKNQIIKVLSSHKGNQSKTAKALGISLNTLKKNIKEYELKEYLIQCKA
jgi:DNA-binding NtrC family response regulator